MQFQDLASSNVLKKKNENSIKSNLNATLVGKPFETWKKLFLYSGWNQCQRKARLFVWFLFNAREFYSYLAGLYSNFSKNLAKEMAFKAMDRVLNPSAESRNNLFLNCRRILQSNDPPRSAWSTSSVPHLAKRMNERGLFSIIIKYD